MSTDSPSPDAEPSPRNPPPENSAKEVGELDLWDLDIDGEEPAENETASTAIPSMRHKVPAIKSKFPTQRPPGAPIVSKDEKAEKEPEPPGEEPTRNPAVPTSGSRGKTKRNVPAAKREPSDLDDLDESASAPPAAKAVKIAEPAGVAEAPDVPKAPEPETDRPRGISIPFIGSLTKFEKIGIVSLIAIFAIAATFTLIHFTKRVPTRALIAAPLNLPVEGELLTATAVNTFWREPVLTGAERNTVRRGTRLIPVLQITFEGGPSAIRVFFRNEDGLVVGDGITRSVSGNGQLTVAATAGFDDIGMHAAYRTGESMPWLVQVFEGPDPNAPREQFKKLLETEISTDIR
jgi:hypothetical protein